MKRRKRKRKGYLIGKRERWNRVWENDRISKREKNREVGEREEKEKDRETYIHKEKGVSSYPNK